MEQKEPWCIGALPVTEIGVLSPDRFEGTGRGGIAPAIKGCTRMLQELGYQFNIIDEQEEFAQYRLIVLPDHVAWSPLLEERINAYIASGGAVLGTGSSGLNPETGTFLHLGSEVSSSAENPYEPDFFVPNDQVGKDLPDDQYVMYRKGVLLETSNPALILAETNSPFFNRTWEHFCSHKHAPSTGVSVYPAAVRDTAVIHLSHPLFSTYDEFDPHWLPVIVRDCISLLMPSRIISHDGPSSLLVTVNRRGDDTFVLHLLGYVAERRAEAFDTVRDVIPVHDTQLTVDVSRQVEQVRLVPQCTDLAFAETADGKITCTVPVIDGHQMLELICREQ